VTPIEEWEALREAVEGMLKIAEAATPGEWFVSNANEGTEYLPLWTVINDAYLTPPGDDDEPWLAIELHTGFSEDTEYVAAHDPSWALSAHREALERLNRHVPYQSFLTGEWVCPNHRKLDLPWPCPEVSGLRSVYMKGEQT